VSNTSILNVVTPAANANLTSLAAAKLRLGVTDNASDAAISALIAGASGLVSAECGGRVFGVETVSETFRWSWRAGNTPLSQSGPRASSGVIEGPPIILARYPIASVVSVTEADVTLDPATDYEADTGAAMLYRLRGDMRSWWSMPKVIVVYSAGYVLPDDTGTRNLPAAVEDAALSLVAAGYESAGRDNAISYELVEGVGRNQYFDRGVAGMSIDPALSAALAPFVLRSR
jgi:hypothetical protein